MIPITMKQANTMKVVTGRRSDVLVMFIGPLS
jgi:hypothetical protein